MEERGSGREERGQVWRSGVRQGGAGSVETPSTSLTAFLCEVTALPYLLEASAPSMLL